MERADRREPAAQDSFAASVGSKVVVEVVGGRTAASLVVPLEHSTVDAAQRGRIVAAGVVEGG